MTRAYTIADVLVKLQMGRATFYRLWKAEKLPCVEELRPRIGGRMRFRADLIDRYVEGRWSAPRTFAGARRHG